MGIDYILGSIRIWEKHKQERHGNKNTGKGSKKRGSRGKGAWGCGRVAGVYTVEAAILMCISLFAIFALVYLAFFIHDEQAARAEMGRILARAAAEGWDEGRICEEWEDNRRCHLFFMKVQEKEAAAGGDKELKVRVSFPVPAYTAAYFRDKERKGWLEEKREVYQPQEFARKAEALKGVLE